MANNETLYLFCGQWLTKREIFASCAHIVCKECSERGHDNGGDACHEACRVALVWDELDEEQED